MQGNQNRRQGNASGINCGAAPATAGYTPGPQPEAVRLGPLGTSGSANDGRPSRLKPWAGMERCPTPPGMA
ncbi:MAG: hypothetical protein IPK53_10755 [bacterium]|nr:hypothetical protein [bacterium]